MTASIMGNIVLSQTSISGSGNDLGFTNPLTVTIATTQDEEDLNKSLIVIPGPKSDSQQEKNTSSSDYGPNNNKFVDLLNKVEERITVDGYLATGVGSSDTSNTAEGKKSDLKKLFLGGGILNMLYEGSVITVAIDKMNIKREKIDDIAADDGEIQFSVKFTTLKGIGFNDE